MPQIATRLRTKVKPKTERPRLHKVILVNDDYTPREFVVGVLKAIFHMSEEQAYRVMITAHQRGVCVVAVFAKDVAETTATQGIEAIYDDVAKPIGMARFAPTVLAHGRMFSARTRLDPTRTAPAAPVRESDLV